MPNFDDPEDVVIHKAKVQNKVRTSDADTLRPFVKLLSFSGLEEIVVGSMKERVTIAVVAQGNTIGLLPFTIEEAKLLIDGLKQSIEDIERGPGLVQ